jgi:ABC-type lipoprotein release transport system permease subunit
MPVKLAPLLFSAAGAIALLWATGAAWLPARKAARADPLTIIRGAA